MQQPIKRKILVVDDNVTNLSIARKALCDNYNVVLIKDGEMALAEIPKVNPDLILLDVEMPGLNGFDVIKKIKSEMDEPFCSVPVIFLTAKDDKDSEYEGLNLGAVDYVVKPFSSALLNKRVELHLKLHDYSTNLEKLVAEKTARIRELQYAIVYALSETVDRRDSTTGGHILRTSEYLRALLEQVFIDGVYADDIADIDIETYAHASQMHDVGKIIIPDSVLLKPESLTESEYNQMKEHTKFGGEIIKSAMNNAREADFLGVAEIFASSHHEKWDGTGYPHGLKREAIPIGGRLMTIVDAYDAITSDRPYKKAKTHEEALELIQKDRGAHFDPLLVDCFMSISDKIKSISQLHNN